MHEKKKNSKKIFIHLHAAVCDRTFPSLHNERDRDIKNQGKNTTPKIIANRYGRVMKNE